MVDGGRAEIERLRRRRKRYQPTGTSSLRHRTTSVAMREAVQLRPRMRLTLCPPRPGAQAMSMMNEGAPPPDEVGEPARSWRARQAIAAGGQLSRGQPAAQLRPVRPFRQQGPQLRCGRGRDFAVRVLGSLSAPGQSVSRGREGRFQGRQEGCGDRARGRASWAADRPSRLLNGGYHADGIWRRPDRRRRA